MNGVSTVCMCEKIRLGDKDCVREMWVLKKCQCQASFGHEWETMRPAGVSVAQKPTHANMRAYCMHGTHTLPAEPEPVPETGLWVYWGDCERVVPFCRANEAWTRKHKGVERVSTALLHPFTHFLPLHCSWWGNAIYLKEIPWEMDTVLASLSNRTLEKIISSSCMYQQRNILIETNRQIPTV